MPESSPSQKLTFAETFEPLAQKRNNLIADAGQYIGEKKEKLHNEVSEVYKQMLNEASKAILGAAKEERGRIVDTAISAFRRSSRINVSEYNTQAFLQDIILKTVELAESRSQQSPQK